MNEETKESMVGILGIVAAVVTLGAMAFSLLLAIVYGFTLSSCRNNDNPSDYKARLSGLAWNCEIKTSATSGWVDKSSIDEKDYRFADLRAEDWSGKDLTRNGFEQTDLRGTNFDGSNLTNAKMLWADLRGASFKGANLTDVDLSDIDMTGANFTGANMTRVNLSNTNRAGAIFTNANMTGVIYEDGRALQRQLNQKSSGDSDAVWTGVGGTGK